MLFLFTDCSPWYTSLIFPFFHACRHEVSDNTTPAQFIDIARKKCDFSSGEPVHCFAEVAPQDERSLPSRREVRMDQTLKKNEITDGTILVWAEGSDRNEVIRQMQTHYARCVCANFYLLSDTSLCLKLRFLVRQMLTPNLGLNVLSTVILDFNGPGQYLHITSSPQCYLLTHVAFSCFVCITTTQSASAAKRDGAE